MRLPDQLLDQAKVLAMIDKTSTGESEKGGIDRVLCPVPSSDDCGGGELETAPAALGSRSRL